MMNGAIADSRSNWWEISDFTSGVGDIKGVWEASRFDWVLVAAQQYLNGRDEGLERLNQWLADWVEQNPTYRGANWKCGQETSIRIMHLGMAALMLGQERATEEGLLDLIEAHLERVAPTISYAIAQDNNHGTSEAVGLFIGGSWLTHNGRSSGKKWRDAGRKLLENRVQRLILPDGSFSQYSTNYHRVMLDTLSMAEVWRNALGEKSFSDTFHERARAATHWLDTMTDAETGRAPILGANDGARLLPLTDTDYRDFRPSVQLASAMFQEKLAYPISNEVLLYPLNWLGVEVPREVKEPPTSEHFADGGYIVLANERVRALLTYPKYKFRPGHSDALHLDVLLDGEPLLVDGGTYSYNASQEEQVYFSGVASHNTIQFDSRDQMPRLSRFLWGAWPSVHSLEVASLKSEEQRSTAGYTDWKGARHIRTVILGNGVLTVEDEVDGFKHEAVLQWRLAGSGWEKTSDGVTNRQVSLHIQGIECEPDIQLVKGWVSEYYNDKKPLDVLECRINTAGRLITHLQIK